LHCLFISYALIYGYGLGPVRAAAAHALYSAVR